MDKEELKRLDKDLRNCCGQVPYTSFTLQFDRIKKVLDNFPHCECLREQCEKTQEDYQRLLSAFEVSKNGIEDPYRDDLLMSIINNIHIIYQDILMLNAIQEEPLLDAAAKRSFNVDLDQLEESVQRLYDHNEREKASTILFSAILVSRHWSNKRSQQFAELICGDTLQIEDACLMISAIMMSNLVIFDNEKFLCLANIYERAENIYVKERALVGWVFSVSPHGNYLTHEVCEKLNNLLLDKEIQAELQDMQKQIFFCMDAEADADIMQKNVFSKFTSNKAKRIIDLSNDIFDETGVEDIIHPEKEEEEVEKMEEGIQQMIQMEKAGSDIYFDGFSKMKSFAFFHVLVCAILQGKPCPPRTRRGTGRQRQTLGGNREEQPFLRQRQIQLRIRPDDDTEVSYGSTRQGNAEGGTDLCQRFGNEEWNWIHHLCQKNLFARSLPILPHLTLP